jgi:hypothetical protein
MRRGVVPHLVGETPKSAGKSSDAETVRPSLCRKILQPKPRWAVFEATFESRISGGIDRAFKVNLRIPR